MKTELIDSGKLSSKLTVVLEPQDYKSKFDTELKKYKQKAHIKGFRKGKTPMSAIRKMYGKSVLAEVVYDQLNKTLENFIIEEKLDILGNPLPAEGQDPVDFDLKELGPFEFQFDIGHAPNIDVKGVSEADKYTSYKVNLTEEDLDEEISQLQKRMGEQIEVDEPIEELDIVSLKIKEIATDKDALFESEISIMPDRMTEEYKTAFLGQKVGFKSQVDIFNFEKDASHDYVKKYFLKDAPDDVNDQFEVEVTAVKRLQPAELSDEFWQKAFGTEEIKDIESAKTKLREDLGKFYDAQALSITKRKILESLIELNDVDMPDEFLKKWLLSSNKDLTKDQLEGEYEGFVKNLRWTLIKKELSQTYELQVTPEAIRAAMIEKIKAQFAQYGYGVMGDFDYDSMADRMMQNQESVQKEYEELLAEMVLDKIIENVSLIESAISTEEYKEIVNDLRQNIG